MSKFLVTGGAGFIGSNIVKALIENGDAVTVLDNFSTGKRENLFEFEDKIEIIEGDIRDRGTVDRAVREKEFVLHQAALPSVERSIKDPNTTNNVNVIGTLNVLLAAKDYGVRRVLYAASSSVYGDTEQMAKVETMTVNPLSPYAISKLAGEYYCKTFSSVYGLDTVILRYFNVFGSKQDPHSEYSAVIPKFISCALKNKKPSVFGDGKQTRDFTFVENVVNANLLAIKKGDRMHGEVFNIACGKEVSVLSIVSILSKIFSRDIEPVFCEARLGEVRFSLADISKAKQRLNYSPLVDFEKGLEKTVQWYRGS